MVRDLRGIRPEYYKLLPILCIHESNELEPILAKECNMALGDIAQAMIPASVIPTALEAISQVSKSTSWKARASVLELLQVQSHTVWKFHDFPTYHSDFYVKSIFEILEVQNMPFDYNI